MTMKKRARKRIRMRPTIEEQSVDILREAGGPMNYREITKEVMRRRPVGSATPENTVYSVFFRSERIVRVGPGMFDLRERHSREEGSENRRSPEE